MINVWRTLCWLKSVFDKGEYTPQLQFIIGDGLVSSTVVFAPYSWQSSRAEGGYPLSFCQSLPHLRWMHQRSLVETHGTWSLYSTLVDSIDRTTSIWTDAFTYSTVQYMIQYARNESSYSPWRWSQDRAIWLKKGEIASHPSERPHAPKYLINCTNVQFKVQFPIARLCNLRGIYGIAHLCD